MNPRFPVYVVTKGRWDNRLTISELQRTGIPFYAVVEPEERERYAEHVAPESLLTLPRRYKEDYELCDDLGLTKSTGPGPARNFAWEHSIENGYDWHWVCDDNIWIWYRMNRNFKIRLEDGAMWRACEDFILRYENVGMAGPQYDFFIPRKVRCKPFSLNTRIYSHNLIRNDLPFRWRGRYNEDTILSLDLLKAGWCTVLFYAFLQKKTPTQKLPGGNTGEFYAKEGTLPKSHMLAKVHPDVTRVVKRFGRWHHHTDYRRFAALRLRRKPGIEVPSGVDNYGMEAVSVEDGRAIPEALRS